MSIQYVWLSSNNIIMAFRYDSGKCMSFPLILSQNSIINRKLCKIAVYWSIKRKISKRFKLKVNNWI